VIDVSEVGENVFVTAVPVPRRVKARAKAAAFFAMFFIGLTTFLI
jgi:hypothetical protein